MVARRAVATFAALVLIAGCDRHHGFIMAPIATPSPPWIQTAGPSTEYVYALLEHDGVLYAGTHANGLRVSLDRGATWEPQSRWDGFGPTLALARTGSVLVLGTYWGLRITDLELQTQLTAGPSNRKTLAVATHQDAVFAGFEPPGLWRSTDEGQTWGVVPLAEFASDSPSAFLSLGADLYAGTTSGALYRTSDDGATWEQVSDGLPGAAVLTLYSSGSKLFAGTRAAGLWVSNDAAVSWDPVGGGLPADTDVNALAQDAGVLLAATGKGLFRSSDGGTSWQITTTCVPANTPFHSFAVVGGDLVAGTLGRGLLRTSDRSTWHAGGPPSTYALAVAEAGNLLLSGGTGIYRSVDGGATWSLTNMTEGGARAFVAVGSAWLAGFQGDGLYRSTDGGASWAPAINGLGAGRYVLSLASNGAGVVAYEFVADAVFWSVNQGTSWQPAIGLPTGVGVTLGSCGPWLLAGVHGSNQPNLYRSADDGVHWLPSNTGLPSDEVICLGSDDTDVYAGTLRNGLYVSHDDGAHWSQTGLRNARVDAVAAHGAQVLASIEDRTKLYYSADRGKTWALVELPRAVISLAAGTNGFVAGVDGSGIWKLPYETPVLPARPRALTRPRTAPVPASDRAPS